MSKGSIDFISTLQIIIVLITKLVSSAHKTDLVELLKTV
jgi:hypothetical protein